MKRLNLGPVSWRLALPIPVATVLLLCASLSAGCDLFTSNLAVNGVVIDTASRQPIPGASILPAGGQVEDNTQYSDGLGAFYFASLREGSQLAIQADGYSPKTVTVKAKTIEVPLEPSRVDVTAVDIRSGQVITLAVLSAPSAGVQSQAPGQFQLVGAKRAANLTVSADGYAPATIAYNGQPSLTIGLRLNSLSGRVTDATKGKPIAGASIYVQQANARSQSDGSYRVTNVPEGESSISVTAAGYASVRRSLVSQATADFNLNPFQAMAPYVSFFAAGDTGMMDGIKRLVDSTSLNAVVIDVKGDRGWIAYKSKVPLAERIGANEVTTVSDIRGLLRDLKKNGVYTIARMVVFKDDLLARNGPKIGLDVAIKDRKTGGGWIDGEGLGWVDPFRQEVWDYNVALAVEAAEMGFDEIQFDYIRFPTDPSADTSVDRTVFSRLNNEQNRLEAVAGFLGRAQAALKPRAVPVSVDVFGFTAWIDDDGEIGQQLEVMGKYADYICPMVYPSTFQYGIPGYPDAVSNPYEIVFYSVRNAVERTNHLPTKIRPWLQYFDDYPWASGKRYDAPQIRSQIRAAAEAGATGWQLWDPFVRYARGGID